MGIKKTSVESANQELLPNNLPPIKRIQIRSPFERSINSRSSHSVPSFSLAKDLKVIKRSRISRKNCSNFSKPVNKQIPVKASLENAMNKQINKPTYGVPDIAKSIITDSKDGNLGSEIISGSSEGNINSDKILVKKHSGYRNCKPICWNCNSRQSHSSWHAHKWLLNTFLCNSCFNLVRERNAMTDKAVPSGLK